MVRLSGNIDVGPVCIARSFVKENCVMVEEIINENTMLHGFLIKTQFLFFFLPVRMSPFYSDFRYLAKLNFRLGVK